jgi:DNA-binding CsgD family transcriptional regulator
VAGYSLRQAGARPQQYAHALLKGGHDLPLDILGGIANRSGPASGDLRIARLEQELEVTRENLRSAICELAVVKAGRKTTEEEASAANEQSRSLSCELHRLREELQCLQLQSINVSACRQTAAQQVADLTTRQRQVMDLVIAGHPSKNIAADLGISQRTVDNHRAAVMKKTGPKSLPALVRTVLAAAVGTQRHQHPGALIIGTALGQPLLGTALEPNAKVW